jgi:putative chitinase
MRALTTELLAKIYPASKAENRQRYAQALYTACCRYGIAENLHRMRAFLAQIGVESGQLAAVEENLNYSASGLRTTFPKYFPTTALATAYARKPQKIANRVYANRLGNGNEASGDGWRYRGRGLIQITGKANYLLLDNGGISMPMGTDLIDEPELLASTPQYAADSAAWWWRKAGLNELADQLGGSNEVEVFKRITKKINGGYNGLAQRQKLYELAKKYLV